MAINKQFLEPPQFSWIDIVDPSAEELAAISKEYSLHEYTLRDCLEPDHLPKHEDLGETHFIITRILTDQDLHNAHTTREISSKVAIFYNDSFIMTVRAYHIFGVLYAADVHRRDLRNEFRLYAGAPAALGLPFGARPDGCHSNDNFLLV
jgi:Mg2+ and Co2+ transporter CorA